MGGGLPYTILYGEDPWDGGVILSLSRAVGSKSTQEQSVSLIHLESLFKCPVGSFHLRAYMQFIHMNWVHEQGSFISGPICSVQFPFDV